MAPPPKKKKKNPSAKGALILKKKHTTGKGLTQKKFKTNKAQKLFKTSNILISYNADIRNTNNLLAPIAKGKKSIF